MGPATFIGLELDTYSTSIVVKYNLDSFQTTPKDLEHVVNETSAMCPYQSNIITPLRFYFLVYFVVGTLNLCHPIPVSEIYALPACSTESSHIIILMDIFFK